MAGSPVPRNNFLKERLMRKTKIYIFVTILIITVKNKRTINYSTYSINH